MGSAEYYRLRDFQESLNENVGLGLIRSWLKMIQLNFYVCFSAVNTFWISGHTQNKQHQSHGCTLKMAVFKCCGSSQIS